MRRGPSLKRKPEAAPLFNSVLVSQLTNHVLLEDDKKAYIELLQEAVNRNIPLKGVYLYGVERPPLLPESANKISKLPAP